MAADAFSVVIIFMVSSLFIFIHCAFRPLRTTDRYLYMS